MDQGFSSKFGNRTDTFICSSNPLNPSLCSGNLQIMRSQQVLKERWGKEFLKQFADVFIKISTLHYSVGWGRSQRAEVDEKPFVF